MIEITRSPARQLRAILRKSLPAGTYHPPLLLQAGEKELSVRVHNSEVAIEWQIAGRTAEAISLSGAALNDFEVEDLVTLARDGKDGVPAEWNDGVYRNARIMPPPRSDCEAERARSLPPKWATKKSAEPGWR